MAGSLSTVLLSALLAHLMCVKDSTVASVDTCSEGDLCEQETGLFRNDDIPSVTDPPLILGRTPERVTVPGSSGVFISVKTTAKYHESRLSLLLLTWLQTVSPNQIHIVTDAGSDDNWATISRNTGFNVVEANCPQGHSRKGLCCKSGVEYESYYASVESGEQYSWFCHFDDDIYVNIPMLVATLEQYNPRGEKLYLGRWSVNKKDKMQIPDYRFKAFPEHRQTSFYYATGAAYCISSALMTELEHYLRGARAFQAIGEELQLPDDMVVGAVVEAILGHEFTDVPNINSHLISLKRFGPDTLKKQVTISYGEFKFKVPEGLKVVKNLVNIPDAVFSLEEDPTRFLSYHCFLYPTTSWCTDAPT